MMKTRPHLLYVGPLLGRRTGIVVTQGFILLQLFRGAGYSIEGVSEAINRFQRLLEITWTLLRRANRDEIVILDIFGGRSFVVEDIASRLTRFSNKKLILVVRGGDMPKFMARFPAWSASILKRAHVLVAPSRFLEAHLGEMGYDITVIPNTIDLDNYVFRQRTPAAPRLFWMRSFHQLYNPMMAVRVLAEVRKTLPDASLVMGGGDKGLLEPTRQLAHELGVADAITFAGYMTLADKQRAFAEADIYINTNITDNMPVTVLEAGASGLVVIATSVGGIPYLVEHEVNALLVPSDDVQAMADAIIRTVQSPDLAASLSQEIRHLAEKSAWECVLPQWEAVFRKF